MNANSIINSAFEGLKVSEIENVEKVNELLDRFGLRWNVELQQLSLPSGKQTPFFGIVRDDNEATFGSVSASYVPFQNSELAELLIRVAGKTGYEIFNGGSLSGGSKVYIQLDTKNKLTGLGENKTTVKGYTTATNRHDGKGSTKWGESDTVICCQNTFSRASKQLANSARHTKSIHEKIEEALREIEVVAEVQKTIFETYIKLAEVPVSKAHIANMVQNLTKVDINTTAAAAKEKFSKQSLDKAQNLLQSIAGEMSYKGQTLWGLFSGVTHYTTHSMKVSDKKENARIESKLMGSGLDIDNEAFELASSWL